MNTRLMTAAIVAIVAGALALSACTATTAEKGDGVWGYVASGDSAQIVLSERQVGATTLAVDRVLAPGPAWVVVHADDDGAPGERVGILHIDRGESRNVMVKLTGLATSKVIVAVHADRGMAGEFDFDMMNKEMSPDRPYFVDGKELAKVVTVR